MYTGAVVWRNAGCAAGETTRAYMRPSLQPLRVRAGGGGVEGRSTFLHTRDGVRGGEGAVLGVRSFSSRTFDSHSVSALALPGALDCGTADEGEYKA